jgi:hypothetical protein
MKNLVTFEADFPDDLIRDDRGTVAVPGGRGIAASLAEELRRLGWSCSAAAQHSFYGWAFTLTASGRDSVAILQFPGPWLLLVTRKRGFWSKLTGSVEDRADPQVLAAIEQVLSADPRFWEVAWWSREGYEAHESQRGLQPRRQRTSPSA